MKIRELIENLSKYDWDSEVEIEGSLSNFGFKIDGIEQVSGDTDVIRLVSYEVIDIDSKSFV